MNILLFYISFLLVISKQDSYILQQRSTFTKTEVQRDPTFGQFISTLIKTGSKNGKPPISAMATPVDKIAHEWSYTGECGPQTWSASFNAALGKHQSPINIETDKAVFCADFVARPLDIKYDANSCLRIKNNGHTFQVDGFQDNASMVTAGPVSSKYNFLQMHMHWGDSLQRGSEHLLDDKAFSAEMHFVNWNIQDFPDPKSASETNTNDGMLVLGVFVQLGKFNNEFEKLCRYMHSIHLKDHSTKVNNINLRQLLPDNTTDYWSYPGSLTTPPCNECVQWVVFRTPVEVAEEQLNKCHELYEVTKEALCSANSIIRYNDRPICSTGDRVVRKSFH